MMPPPITRSPRYQTTDCPGVTARCGTSKTTSAAASGRARTDAGAAVLADAAVVMVGHEADLLALGLVRRGQPPATRVGPHLLLRQVAHGKARGGELGLRERPQKIGLVLSNVAPSPEQVASRRAVARHPRVVSGGDGGGVPGGGAPKQRSEL